MLSAALTRSAMVFVGVTLSSKKCKLEAPPTIVGWTGGGAAWERPLFNVLVMDRNIPPRPVGCFAVRDMVCDCVSFSYAAASGLYIQIEEQSSRSENSFVRQEKVKKMCIMALNR